MLLNPPRTGVAFGAVIGLWHLAWTALVGLGVAKPVLDFVLWLHFVQIPVGLQSFDLGRAALLVTVSFAAGLALGMVFAVAWNWAHRGAQAA